MGTMESGFSAMAGAAAVLLGLVLVAIEFAFNAVKTRAGSIEEVRDYSWWVWSSGFYCCLCYMYVFLVSVHLLRGSYSQVALIAVTAVTSVLLLTFKVAELVFLKHMSDLDWNIYRRIFITDIILALVISPAVFTLVWLAVLNGGSELHRYELLYTAVKYVLIIASIRAVILIGLAFQALVNFERISGRKRCEYCMMWIPGGAVRCPYCRSELGDAAGEEGGER